MTKLISLRIYLSLIQAEIKKEENGLPALFFGVVSFGVPHDAGIETIVGRKAESRSERNKWECGGKIQRFVKIFSSSLSLAVPAQ